LQAGNSASNQLRFKQRSELGLRVQDCWRVLQKIARKLRLGMSGSFGLKAPRNQMAMAALSGAAPSRL
jgi:hypothetical protein